MTFTIVENGKEHQAFNWTEAADASPEDRGPMEDHSRNRTLLNEGVSELAPGEVYFECDNPLAFDTTFSLKGDGRKFVVIASSSGRHVAKPY